MMSCKGRRCECFEGDDVGDDCPAGLAAKLATAAEKDLLYHVHEAGAARRKIWTYP